MNILNACEKKEIPIVTTSEVSNITGTTAICGGVITDEGSSTIITRGVCWSTGTNPSIENDKTSDGAGAGTFTSNITGLTGGTTYFVRAYATNNVGTGYGMAMSFTTQLTDIDGNTYNTITIGEQVWIAENLKTTKFRNGEAILNVSDNTQWSTLIAGGYCDYDNNINNSTTYGHLYNWYSVNDSRKICPTDWHVPTDAEWAKMMTFLGGESIAGGKLKETGILHWTSPNTGATNESKFTALPGGYRWANGTFERILLEGLWWSATEISGTTAWDRMLDYNSSTIRYEAGNKSLGLSVRCIKDN